MTMENERDRLANNVGESNSHWDSVAETWFKDMTKILTDRKHIILLLVLIIMVATVTAILLNHEWQVFLFTTNENRFQWVGITAAAAGIGICINAIQARKKYKADLISKSRIDWIAQTKPVLSEFMVLSSKSIVLLTEIKRWEMTYISGNPDNEDNQITFKNYSDKIDNYNELNEQLQRVRRHIIMSFSDADDNEQIVSKITAIDDVREGYLGFLNTVDDPDVFEQITDSNMLEGNSIHMNRLIEDLMNESRDYFKNEWDRAKRGE